MKTVVAGSAAGWSGHSLVLSTVTFDRLWYAEWSGDASGFAGLRKQGLPTSKDSALAGYNY